VTWSTNPQIKRKGATMPYTSVNGNMFSLLTPDGTLALRLPPADRESFLKRYDTELCVQYGVVIKPKATTNKTCEKKARQAAVNEEPGKS
jgi:hypothetical protein